MWLWQGRFKRALPVPDVLTGQRFRRGVRNLPARWLVEAVLIKARAGHQGCLSACSPLRWCMLLCEHMAEGSMQSAGPGPADTCAFWLTCDPCDTCDAEEILLCRPAFLN